MPLPRHLTHGRRAGTIPGRRSAFVAVICAALALPSGAVADGSDFAVLVGNVYGAGPTPQPFRKTFEQLSTCQNAPPATYEERGPGGTDFFDGLGGANSWTLDEALICGPSPVLSSPQFGDITVFDVNDAPEAQAGSAITPQDFSGSGNFPPDTFPLVSVPAASSTQIEYDRPWRGGDDLNAPDRVGPSAQPITVDVFTGAQLTVTVTPSPAQITPGGPVTFTPNIAPLTQGLTYEWNFGNGDTSNDADPTETFTGPGNYPVSVVVHDDQGAGGAGSLTLTVGNAPPATTTGATTGAFTTSTPTTGTIPGPPTRHPRRHHQPGPGTHPGTSTTSTTTTGTTHTATTTTASSSSATTPTTSTTHTASAPPAPGVSPGPGTPAPTTPTATTPTTLPPVTSTATTSTPSPTQTAPTQTTPTPAPAHPSRLPLVTGRLIAAVNAVPAGSSPLTHVVVAGSGAAAVAEVPNSSSFPWVLIGSLCAVAALLGLGALRERRAGPDWRSLRPPWGRPR